MKRAIVIGFLFFLTASTVWFLNQNMTEGYVFSSNNEGSRVQIISLDASEENGVTPEEIISILKTKASNYQGVVYDIPFVNKALNSSFQSGEKVKVYWNGPVLTSAPAQVKGTVLIVKSKRA